MKKYKTMIISGSLVLRALGIMLLSSLVTVTSFNITEKRFSGEDAYIKIINDNISVTNLYKEKIPFRNIKTYLEEIILGYSTDDAISVIKGTLPIYREIKIPEIIIEYENVKNEPFEDKYEKKYKNRNDKIIPPENQAPIKEVDLKQKVAEDTVVSVGNETSYSIDINSMLSETPKIDMSVMGPKVLITHTHATECYAGEGMDVYDVTESDRCEDISKNVVAVGNKLYEILNSKGIDTLHDKVLHDKPSFNGSYAHSLNTVEEYLKKYPTIQVIFDIHRDSIVYDDKTKAKAVTEINGKDAAQLMFVVGTDEKGLHNPEWKENLISAIHFQKEITEKYPGLMRHINLRKERFNGHTSNASIIVEVGTSGNSLEEAIYGIEIMGECIGNYLKRL